MFNTVLAVHSSSISKCFVYFWPMVSLKGRLPEILQSTSTLSCDIIQIHSLFRHGFIKKPKSKFNGNRKRILFDVTDFEKQILVLV